MKRKRKLVWKNGTPVVEIPENANKSEIEEKEHEKLLEVTMNPHDYLQFEEVILCPYCESEDTYYSGLAEGFEYRCNACGKYFNKKECCD